MKEQALVLWIKIDKVKAICEILTLFNKER